MLVQLHGLSFVDQSSATDIYSNDDTICDPVPTVCYGPGTWVDTAALLWGDLVAACLTR